MYWKWKKEKRREWDREWKRESKKEREWERTKMNVKRKASTIEKEWEFNQPFDSIVKNSFNVPFFFLSIDLLLSVPLVNFLAYLLKYPLDGETKSTFSVNNEYYSFTCRRI